MELIGERANHFLHLYVKNLKAGLESKPDLRESLNELLNYYLRSKDRITENPIILFSRYSLIGPLKITDIMIKRIKNYTTNKITDTISNVLIDLPSNKRFRKIVGFIKIPQYYGGMNKNTKNYNPLEKNIIICQPNIKNLSSLSRFTNFIKKKYLNFYRDELQIDFMENELIPSLFHQTTKNPEFLLDLKDTKTKTYLNNFLEHMRNKFGLNNNDFISYHVIDLRNIDTDGFNDDDEINFGFNIELRIRYLKDKIISENCNFKINVKMSRNNKILGFDYKDL